MAYVLPRPTTDNKDVLGPARDGPIGKKRSQTIGVVDSLHEYGLFPSKIMPGLEAVVSANQAGPYENILLN